MKKILLYSGGMDSWLIDKLWKPDIKLYVDMDTKYSVQERNKLDYSVTQMHLPLGDYERPDSIIPLRNAFLVELAVLSQANNDEDIVIGLGSMDGDRCLDQNPKFAKLVEKLVNHLYEPQSWTPGKKIKVELPFKDHTKKELLLEYVKQGGDVKKAWEESLSCYSPQGELEEPCWGCKPCVRKWLAFEAAGFQTDKAIRDKVLGSPAMFDIIRKLEKGQMARSKKEDKDIKMVLEKYGIQFKK